MNISSLSPYDVYLSDINEPIKNIKSNIYIGIYNTYIIGYKFITKF
jgi:hypothetical protein